MIQAPRAQGDLLFIPVDEIPQGAVAVEPTQGRHILALGEATGHAHTVAADDCDLLTVSGQVDRWLRVRSQTPVLHEEHDALPLDVGIYVVRPQREYSPEEIRRVAD